MHVLRPGLMLIASLLFSVVQAHSLPLVYVQDRAGVDLDYFKEEIEFVRFVEERSAADVVLTLTSQSTGSGGIEYLLALRGRERFEGLDQDFAWAAGPTASTEERYDGLTEVLMRGLVPYVAQTDAGEFVFVEYDPEEDEDEFEETPDPWNNWVFEAGVEGSADGEEHSYEYGFEAVFEAARVTEYDKLMLSSSASLAEEYEAEEEEEGEEEEEEVYREVFREFALDAQYSWLLGQHLAAGVFGEAKNSEYANLFVGVRAGPMVEFSFFPYRERHHRDVRLTFRLAGIRNSYYDTTVYGVTSEFLMQHETAVRVGFMQEWGDINLGTSWSSYLHDFGLNRVSVSAGMELELGSGFGLELEGNYAFIHDQIALRADPEEEYEEPTDYSYEASIGLFYNFGSIYSDIVNPAFD